MTDQPDAVLRLLIREQLSDLEKNLGEKIYAVDKNLSEKIHTVDAEASTKADRARNQALSVFGLTVAVLAILGWFGLNQVAKEQLEKAELDKILHQANAANDQLAKQVIDFQHQANAANNQLTELVGRFQNSNKEANSLIAKLARTDMQFEVGLVHCDYSKSSLVRFGDQETTIIVPFKEYFEAKPQVFVAPLGYTVDTGNSDESDSDFSIHILSVDTTNRSTKITIIKRKAGVWVLSFGYLAIGQNQTKPTALNTDKISAGCVRY